MKINKIKPPGKSGKEKKMKTIKIKKFYNGYPMAEEKEIKLCKNNLIYKNNLIEYTQFRFTELYILSKVLGNPSSEQKKLAEEVSFLFPPKEKKWVEENKKLYKKEVITTDSPNRYFYEEDFATKKLKCLENYIELDNNEWIYNDYGKYCSNITFLLSTPRKLEWERVPASYFNLPGGNFETMRGIFWTNKKGTKCFRPLENGTHLLVREDWVHGTEGKIKEIPHLYFRQASSNAGRTGYNYNVFLIEKHKYKMNAEDFE